MIPDAMAVADHTFDLLIQIDGFQEMDSKVIDNYYANLTLAAHGSTCRIL